MAKLPIPFPNPTTYKGHSGVDFGQPRGTPFRASGPGRVTTLGRNRRGGFYIWVQYDTGARVGYHHMDSHQGCPQVGSRVAEGTLLGYVGNTGNSTGPHLHSEISGEATTAGYWRHFTAERVVGQDSPASSGRQDVRNRQSWLNKSRGEKLAVDGLFGRKTKAAIKRYQRFLKKSYGYKGAIDGIWGKGTQTAHQRYYDAWHKPKGRPVVREGSRGQDVRDLQARLNRDYPLYSKLKVDGIFGAGTRKVVREFQRRAGLKVDGIVGGQTWARLCL